MTKLRIGVIGVGGIATGRHIPAFLQLPTVELVAVSDMNKAQAQKVAKDFDIPYVCEQLEDMLDKIDALVICTPNKFHAPIAIQALNAGVHVLCEKPMALNTQECEAMTAAAEKSGKVLLIAYHWRFMKESRAAKQLIELGEIGEPLVIRIQSMRRRKVPGWGVFTNRDLQGGGALIDYGCHLLDLALWLVGNPKPAEVSGATFNALSRQQGLVNEWGTIDAETFEVEDHATAFIRLENGAVILLETSWAANILADEESLSISGTKGGIDVFPLRINKAANGMLMTNTVDFIPEEKSYDLLQAEHFVACCLGESTAIASPQESMHVSSVIEAIYESSTKGASVTINSN
ncbi:Gfo/Idh/MocA family protein [Lysinibacillus piscis]|uniref:Gfo/Idh/MocA family oxidoreductase n=1 Tax=Lysinibacillus piscis TaxID=2518931 RepID=A0ABQ5NKQ3_9BACI|nr:Gfo/Idh/MocA family oxidoreductase [Lysinibacillus sp. KH24]GLC88946.1 Gfo/Idh/MocA family oxidoreductase [Lysinibacillus sp. KH24]